MVSWGDAQSVERVRYFLSPINTAASNVRTLLQLLDVIRKSGGSDIQLIVVLFPNKADDIRARVKHWGDIRYGMKGS